MTLLLNESTINYSVQLENVHLKGLLQQQKLAIDLRPAQQHLGSNLITGRDLFTARDMWRPGGGERVKGAGSNNKPG